MYINASINLASTRLTRKKCCVRNNIDTIHIFYIMTCSCLFINLYIYTCKSCTTYIRVRKKWSDPKAHLNNYQILNSQENFFLRTISENKNDKKEIPYLYKLNPEFTLNEMTAAFPSKFCWNNEKWEKPEFAAIATHYIFNHHDTIFIYPFPNFCSFHVVEVTAHGSQICVYVFQSAMYYAL